MAFNTLFSPTQAEIVPRGRPCDIGIQPPQRILQSGIKDNNNNNNNTNMNKKKQNNNKTKKTQFVTSIWILQFVFHFGKQT